MKYRMTAEVEDRTTAPAMLRYLANKIENYPSDPDIGHGPGGNTHGMVRAENGDVIGEFFIEDERYPVTEPTITDRGFKHMNPIEGAYGGSIRVYESSAASGPHIWAAIEQLTDLNDPSSKLFTATVHLSLDSAVTLREQIHELIETHYQVQRR